MTIFGLNSPELFVLIVITLVILGTKRIEKGLDLLSRLLKFLLSNQSSIDKTTKEKEPIKDMEEIQNKEEEIVKIEEKPNVKEKELKKDMEEIQNKEEEIVKIGEKANAKEDKSNKRLKVANVDKKEINSAKIKGPKVIEKDKTGKKLKTRNPKSTVKDKTVIKSKTINVQKEQLEK